MTARRVVGGLVLEGEAPWVSAWGLADLFAVAARVDDRVVFVAVPATARGLHPSAPLRLAAMGASSTVRLRFDGLAVPDGDVIADLPFAQWRQRDQAATAQPNPAAFGVAAACTGRLAELEPALAHALEQERLECREESYGAGVAAPGTGLDRLVELRAWSLELAMRCAYALVAATGGRSMVSDHPAQRLLREAAFYAIQAQTPALRAATLARLRRSR